MKIEANAKLKNPQRGTDGAVTIDVGNHSLIRKVEIVPGNRGKLYTSLYVRDDLPAPPELSEDVYASRREETKKIAARAQKKLSERTPAFADRAASLRTLMDEIETAASSQTPKAENFTQLQQRWKAEASGLNALFTEVQEIQYETVQQLEMLTTASPVRHTMYKISNALSKYDPRPNGSSISLGKGDSKELDCARGALHILGLPDSQVENITALYAKAKKTEPTAEH